MTLQEFFCAHPQAAVAFSGGADSAFLLWAAKHYGCAVRAYCVKTCFQPRFELDDARRLAGALDVPLTVIEADVLSVPQTAENGPERCYFCKRALFTEILAQARADGFDLLLDGTNASDDAGDRPGMRALKELAVCSPLRVCGLSKEQVRALSRKAGLFTWNKPAYACLATRIPAGRAITAGDLTRVERGEEALATLGFSDFRLRLGREGRSALLQVTEGQLPLALERREALLSALGGDFDAVALDLAPRAAST